MNNIQNQIEKCEQAIEQVRLMINNQKRPSQTINYTNVYNELYALIHLIPNEYSAYRDRLRDKILPNLKTKDQMSSDNFGRPIMIPNNGINPYSFGEAIATIRYLSLAVKKQNTIGDIKKNDEYVNSERISELENVSTQKFDLTKLIKFCKELNHAYVNGSYLTIPLLVRAIIDHIPPIFGKAIFDEVRGSYGTRSFKDNMNKLESCRKIADSIIHTKIRNKEVLPNKTQINFKADLDVLLGEIYRIFK